MKQKCIQQLLIKLFITAFCAGFTGNGSNAQVFIRIYNDHGKKIGKGTLELIADTALVVITNDKKQLQGFLVTEISFIKTKRSFGANIGMGAAVGALPLLLLKNNSNFDDDEWKIFGIVTASTIAAGTIIGLISGVTTKREKFLINGDVETWKTVKDQLLPSPKNNTMPG